MSDFGRKSFTEKTRENLVPNETKPASQKIKESVTNVADKIAAVVQPKETKSLPQHTADKLNRPPVIQLKNSTQQRMK